MQALDCGLSCCGLSGRRCCPVSWQKQGSHTWQPGAGAGCTFLAPSLPAGKVDFLPVHRLQKAGVELDDAGAVKVDTFSRTNQRHIFAVGDVTNRLNLTPVALMEGMAVAATLFGEKEKPADHKNVRASYMPKGPAGDTPDISADCHTTASAVGTELADVPAVGRCVCLGMHTCWKASKQYATALMPLAAAAGRQG